MAEDPSLRGQGSPPSVRMTFTEEVLVEGIPDLGIVKRAIISFERQQTNRSAGA
jgi:hypothetical protein